MDNYICVFSSCILVFCLNVSATLFAIKEAASVLFRPRDVNENNVTLYQHFLISSNFTANYNWFRDQFDRFPNQGFLAATSTQVVTMLLCVFS